MYGASKARAEALVEQSALDWSIVRPPAVYGPGDRETLELFKMARLGLMLMPPDGRLSLIHAKDLARLLLALAPARGSPIRHHRARRRPSRGLDPQELRDGARRSGREKAADRLGSRAAAPPRRPRRPPAARRQGQAHSRPRGLFLPPRLARQSGQGRAARPLGAADRNRPRPGRNGRMVPPRGLALKPPHSPKSITSLLSGRRPCFSPFRRGSMVAALPSNRSSIPPAASTPSLVKRSSTNGSPLA